MLLSLNWLRDYIDLPKNVTPQQLAHDLTMATVEVESITDQAEQFEKMVVGQVAKLRPHPNADKLKVAVVDISKALGGDASGSAGTPRGAGGLVQIVCGGTNLREGMYVPVALPCAKVRWHGEGDLVTMQEAKIRGEKSFGMICSSNEIGLENMFPCGEMEIVDLNKAAPTRGLEPTKVVGQPLVKALGLNDVIIEIDNQSLTNRPDLWCHHGIARELAAIYNLKLKSLDIEDIKKYKDIKGINFKVEIKDKKLCSRYIGCLVKNIKIEPSPEWLVKRLEAVGQRAINNIVDITNYVMFDVGEPTHAFDAQKLANPSRIKTNESRMQMVVRRAKKGEKMKTLDGEMRELDETMLVIADSKGPVAAAGVMGGAKSEVCKDTNTLILECANFDAMTVRKMSQKLGLRTEGSIRWEKALDPNLAEIACQRMLKLIKEIMPQAEVVAWVDENYACQDKKVIKVGHKFLEQRIGQKFNKKDVINVLARLGFIVETHSNASLQETIYSITVPSWRATGDVSIPEDIVEEVARIYGYDNLKEKVEKVEMKKAIYQPEYDLENKIKNYLSVDCRMSEVFNYPWLEQRILKKFGVTTKDMIEIANPPAEENRFLQTSLIPNLIKNIEDNLRYYSEFKLFELARVFNVETRRGVSHDGDDKLPVQPKMLAGAVVTKKPARHASQGKAGGDAFLEVKGILQGMGLEFGTSAKLGFLNKDKSLEVVVGGKQIGWFGEIKDKIKNKNIGLFEIDFSKLAETHSYVSLQKKYKPLPQHPLIERDIAVEVDWKVKWGDIKDGILCPPTSRRGPQDDILKKVEFLSEYDLGNKKSLAFRVTYQADRTLKDAEVEVVEKKIIKMLEKKFGAKLRG